MSIFYFKEKAFTEITLTDRWLKSNINRLANLTNKTILIVDKETNKVLRKLNVSKNVDTETFPYNDITTFRALPNFNSEYPYKYHIIEKEKQMDMVTSNHLIYAKDFIELEDVIICFTFAYCSQVKEKLATNFTSNPEFLSFKWYDYVSRLGIMDINSNKSLKYTLHREGPYYRIRATKNIPSKGVKRGTWGGLVLCRSNLSHYETCWIHEGASVTRRSSIVFGNASVYGQVLGAAEIGHGVIIGPNGKILNSGKNVLDVNYSDICEHVANNIIREGRVDNAVNWYKETSNAYLININLPIFNTCNIKNVMDVHMEEDYIFSKLHPYDSARYNTAIDIPRTALQDAQILDINLPNTYVDYLSIACNRPNPPLNMCLRAIRKIYCRDNSDVFNNLLVHNTVCDLKNKIIKNIS